MAGFGDVIRNEFKRGAMHMRLIIINLAVFLIINISLILVTLMKWDIAYIPWHWMAATSKLELLLYKPWSLVTYMFVHVDFYHILFNMLILYFTSRIFIQFMGEKKLLNTYLLGGLAGAAMHIIAQNVFPLLRELTPIGGDVMIGASASVMAIFVGAAVYAPNLEVFLFGLIRLKLKWIALFYVFTDIAGLGAMDGVAHFAHLGGAIWGFAAVSSLKKGKDIGRWFDGVIDFFSFKRRPKRRTRMKVKYSAKRDSGRHTPPRDDHEYNARKADTQKRIDEILDKISKSGYESLTKEEKAFLFNYSKNAK